MKNSTKTSEKISNLKKKKVPIIIDRKKEIKNATKLIPNVCPILCWNHIHQGIKHWVQSHNGISDDIVVYMDHVMQLLKSEIQDQFEERYMTFSTK